MFFTIKKEMDFLKKAFIFFHISIYPQMLKTLYIKGDRANLKMTFSKSKMEEIYELKIIKSRCIITLR